MNLVEHVQQNGVNYWSLGNANNGVSKPAKVKEDVFKLWREGLNPYQIEKKLDEGDSASPHYSTIRGWVRGWERIDE